MANAQPETKPAGEPADAARAGRGDGVRPAAAPGATGTRLRRSEDASLPDAAEFVEFFALTWSIGAADPERFFDLVAARTAPDARFVQPLRRELRGAEGVRELFEPLFEALPDLHGVVERWGATADGVVVELTLRGTLAGRPLEWTTADRIVLRDGMIQERRAYFDPLPLVATLLRRPRSLGALMAAMVRHRRAR